MTPDKLALRYCVRRFRGNTLVDEEIVNNIIPAEGIALLSDALFHGGALPAAWYMGLYETNYTPTGSVTAATINALATESTAYAEATRPLFVGVTQSVGVVNNTASPAVFTFNATKNIYGGFLSSSPTKANPSGVLLSVVKFATVKPVDSSLRLEVEGGLTLVSA